MKHNSGAQPLRQPESHLLLETPRLSLRKLIPADAPFILELLNEPPFLEFVGDRNVRTVADAANYIAQKVLPSYAHPGLGFYLVELKKTREPIGICGLVKRDTLDDIDIGFSLLTRFCGNGYAYESASALFSYGRTTLGLARIVGITAPNNASSIRLLEKLGLRFEKLIHLPGYGNESKLFGNSNPVGRDSVEPGCQLSSLSALPGSTESRPTQESAASRSA